MTTTNARSKRDRATIGKALIAKAYGGFRPLPFYFENGSAEAVVQTLNVNVINTARAVLVSHGYGYKPSAAARTFTKRFVDAGEFPGRFGALLKEMARLDHEADFSPRFSISEPELRELESEARAFLAAAEEYLNKD
jgi:uncharacterized protein (UPF0332 family)